MTSEVKISKRKKSDDGTPSFKPNLDGISPDKINLTHDEQSTFSIIIRKVEIKPNENFKGKRGFELPTELWIG